MSRFGSKEHFPAARSWASRALAVLVVGLVAALGVAGCGSSDGGGGTSTDASTSGSAKPHTIGFLALSLQDQFGAQQAAQLRRLVEDAGDTFVVLDPSNDPGKQLQITEDALTAHKVDALIGSTVDINAFQPALDQAAEQGVPVVFLDKQPAHFQRGETLITQDFTDWGLQMGKAAARCVDDRLGGKGEAVVLDNVERSGDIIKRLIDGVKEGLATNPGVKVVAQPDAPDRLKTLQVMQDVLRVHPDVNVVLGAGDDPTLGAMQALEGAGKDATKLCLVGTGGTAEGEKAVKSGKFYAEVDIRLPYLYGVAVKTAKALIENPDDPAYSGKVVPTTIAMRYHG
jgi:ribose transport system substrate-binding protein